MKFFVVLSLASLIASYSTALPVAEPDILDNEVDAADPDQHEHGKPLRIVKFVNQTVEVDTETLEKLLMNEEVRNREVVLVSIVGASSNGKSTFMDYCLRYMYANYDSVNVKRNGTTDSDWMGEPDDQLKGFVGLKGTKKETSGIIMWSDVFLYTTENRKDLAIILADTQGLQDDPAMEIANNKLFAVGLLQSSIQIYNTKSLNQEKYLKYLKVGTDFGKFNKETQILKTNPFQDIMFLIRDWDRDAAFPYGLNGGERYLKSVFEMENENQIETLQEIKRHINQTFETRYGSLLPNPGTKFIGQDGAHGKMSPDFRKYLEKTIEFLLEPSNLKTKKYGGIPVKAHELRQYLENIYEIFKTPGELNVEQVYQIVIDTQLQLVLEDAWEIYRLEMLEKLATAQELAAFKTESSFVQHEKLSGKEQTDEAGRSLKKTLEDVYKRLQEIVLDNDADKREIERLNGIIDELTTLNSKLEAENTKLKKDLEDCKTENDLQKQQCNEDKTALQNKIDQKDEEIAQLDKKLEKCGKFAELMRWDNGVKIKEFYVSTARATWDEAVKQCHDNDMELARFDSTDEAKALFNEANQFNLRAWIGMKRDDTGNFKNIDGTTIDLPWADGEPNNENGNEDCAEVRTESGGYNDVRCDIKKSFICQEIVPL